MTERERILVRLRRRDPALFMQGACHIFAVALSEKFGYSCFAVRREDKLPHVYCLGVTLAVDGKGRRHEDYVLSEFVHFPGPLGYCREIALHFRVPFTMRDAFAADRGLLTEEPFLTEATAFAQEHITAHEAEYEKA